MANVDIINTSHTGMSFSVSGTELVGDATASINAQTGTTYTLVLGDAQDIITLDNASAITVTIPASSSVAFKVGTVVGLVQAGAGGVTVAPASGVTLNSDAGATSIAGQWKTAALTYLGSDVWLLSGDIS